MEFNLAWVKQHKVAVAAVVLGGLVVLYLLAKKSSGSSSGIGGVLATQSAGQLQMTQLNAQLSAQGQQTQAQLDAQIIAANAEQQHSQDIIAGELALYGLEGSMAKNAITAQQAQEAELLPLEQQLISYSSSGKLVGHPLVGQAIENELALLLAEGGGGNPALLGAAGGLPPIQPGSGAGAGFNISIPGVGSLGVGGL